MPAGLASAIYATENTRLGYAIYATEGGDAAKGVWRDEVSDDEATPKPSTARGSDEATPKPEGYAEGGYWHDESGDEGRGEGGDEGGDEGGYEGGYYWQAKRPPWRGRPELFGYAKGMATYPAKYQGSDAWRVPQLHKTMP